MKRISTNNAPSTPSPNQAAQEPFTPPRAPQSPLSEPPLMRRQAFAQANGRTVGGGANMPSLPERSTPSPAGSVAPGLPARRVAAPRIALRQRETEEPAAPVAHLNRDPGSLPPHEQDAAADEEVASINRHLPDPPQ
jgi:hypothetical protein